MYYKNTGDYPPKTPRRRAMNLLVDVLQMLSHFLFCAFIYYAMIIEDEKFKNLGVYFRIFLGFTIVYILAVVGFPLFMSRDFVVFLISRMVIIGLSLVFYIQLYKNLDKVFFRYLFAAVSFVFLSGFLALWDSFSTEGHSKYTGFDYLCYGFFLENLCFVGAFVYRYFKVNKEKKEAEELYLTQLYATKLEIQQQTMDNIGKEIHDNIGQKLTLASIYMQQLEHENKQTDTKEGIQNISGILNETLWEMRELTKSLTQNSISEQLIYDLIQKECERVEKLKIIKVKFLCYDKKLILDTEIKTILVRIVQEFIQNSIKHSECETISIVMHSLKQKATLVLTDDGIGFDLEKRYSNGMGLKNMEKRVKMILGTFAIESKINVGTKITITLPI
ncbi:MAG: sensor histidine kinase [Flavobacterium sp.]|uniref:sensor histidine kinase n=1 Tax=Flavobacterium sp. TaxID=239 RepID=UPI0022BBD1EA|nr:sensor histidine kinase [Flavobacterium sp.]MCZ8332438.1 sensor histidine kinase [Flavobacterium sp.]